MLLLGAFGFCRLQFEFWSKTAREVELAVEGSRKLFQVEPLWGSTSSQRFQVCVLRGASVRMGNEVFGEVVSCQSK